MATKEEFKLERAEDSDEAVGTDDADDDVSAICAEEDAEAVGTGPLICDEGMKRKRTQDEEREREKEARGDEDCQEGDFPSFSCPGGLLLGPLDAPVPLPTAKKRTWDKLKEKLEREKEELEREKEELKREKEELKREKEELKREKEKLERQKEELKGDNDELMQAGNNEAIVQTIAEKEKQLTTIMILQEEQMRKEILLEEQMKMIRNQLAEMGMKEILLGSPFKKPKTKVGSSERRTPRETLEIMHQSNKEWILLLEIECSGRGRAWDLVHLFITSSCLEFDISKYTMNTDSEGGGKQIDLAAIDPSFIISPGKYYLISKDSNSTPLQFKKKFPIIPTSKADSRQSPSPGVESASGEVCRTQKFREAIWNRDQGCLISSFCARECLVASHILAYAWSKRLSDLPQHVRSVVQGFKDGINDIRNGLLLSSNHSKAFDLGFIAIRRKNDEYYVVAIKYPELFEDGKKLRHTWNGPTDEPDPTLLQFHLESSVLRHMCARGQVDSDYDDDDNDDENSIRQVREILTSSLIEAF